MRKLIDFKKLRLAERDIERQQFEAKQEQRRADRRADREQRTTAEKISKQRNLDNVNINVL